MYFICRKLNAETYHSIALFSVKRWKVFLNSDSQLWVVIVSFCPTSCSTAEEEHHSSLCIPAAASAWYMRYLSGTLLITLRLQLYSFRHILAILRTHPTKPGNKELFQKLESIYLKISRSVYEIRFFSRRALGRCDAVYDQREISGDWRNLLLVSEAWSSMQLRKKVKIETKKEELKARTDGTTELCRTVRPSFMNFHKSLFIQTFAF